ncbi:MAG TPA: uracil-DNA glycosylase [Ignavibacteriaceae bacterium]|nr:uracil-DNA glycosylase [Ignavibacteriaceae bacterium]
MTKVPKDKIVRVLKDQQEIFGDDLFEPKDSLAKTSPKSYPEKKTGAEKILVKEPAIEKQQLFQDSVESWQSVSSLDELNKLICDCTKCVLHKNRNKFVFGSGNPNADVMVIGEGPGADEDAQGLPFVGRAGKLLTDILKAIKFERDEVYIANIVKCRPPGNRTPLPEEMETCIPYLKKQIELIKPKLILCLGLTAAKGLLKRKESLGNLRGKVFEYEGISVMVTFHPAALLRNPNWKSDCWEDVQKFRKLYDQM